MPLLGAALNLAEIIWQIDNVGILSLPLLVSFYMAFNPNKLVSMNYLKNKAAIRD